MEGVQMKGMGSGWSRQTCQLHTCNSRGGNRSISSARMTVFPVTTDKSTLDQSIYRPTYDVSIFLLLF